MFPPCPEPGEQWKKDGFGSRLRQSDGLLMVENSRPGADSKQGESALGRRRRGREIIVCWKKGVTPPYIGQGVTSSSPPPCGTKPPRGGVRRPRGGWAPPVGAK